MTLRVLLRAEGETEELTHPTGLLAFGRSHLTLAKHVYEFDAHDCDSRGAELFETHHGLHWPVILLRDGDHDKVEANHTKGQRLKVQLDKLKTSKCDKTDREKQTGVDTATGPSSKPALTTCARGTRW